MISDTGDNPQPPQPRVSMDEPFFPLISINSSDHHLHAEHKLVLNSARGVGGGELNEPAEGDIFSC